MKRTYIDIMERALSNYTEADIDGYIAQTLQDGPGDQGFARLTSNIGILLAQGRCEHLLPRFVRMMDICCDLLPNRKGVANDFSVKELCFCLMAVEESCVVPAEKMEGWKSTLRSLNPEKTYDCIAVDENDTKVNNWAGFSAASEWMRRVYLGAENMDFLEKQTGSQTHHFDENGMYKDPGCPMNYDFVPRLQFDVMLRFGYNGKYAALIDENLRKAGELTLRMQSVTGEMPYGGRSMQFLFNEAVVAGVCEYEAARHAKLGDAVKAGQFKAAAQLAAGSILQWLDLCKGHVKNNFPIESKYGCEGYGHFLKYMITVASFIYTAYLFADDSIAPTTAPAAQGGYVARTGADFHKIFANSGGYFLEWDTNADFHYDANGLGRVHKAGVPGSLCLSVPFATQPHYALPQPNPFPASIAAFVEKDGTLRTGAEQGAAYAVLSQRESQEQVELELLCTLPDGTPITEKYRVSASGVDIQLEGVENGGLLLPVFASDGENATSIVVEAHGITVKYHEYECSYAFDGTPKLLHENFNNRNGRYAIYAMYGKHVHIELL